MMRMSSFDMISMAMRNLWKRKLRTFLTVLGVIIGTASIVVMVSIGIGMNEGYKAQIEEMGSLQVINVNAPYEGGGGRMAMSLNSASSSNRNKKSVVLDSKAIEEFKNIKGVEAVTPVVSEYLQIISGKYMNDVSFKGIDPETAEAMGYKVSEGRLLNGDDKAAIMVGANVKDYFYNPKLNWQMRYTAEHPEINLFEDKVLVTYDYNYGTKNADKKIKPYKVEMAGLIEGNGDDSNSVVMPIKELEKIIADKKKYEDAQNKGSRGGGNNQNKTKKGVYDQVMVKVENMDDVKAIQDLLKEMGYETYSLSDYLTSMQETSKMLQMVLGAIGAISLFVAAIGITNTMVMSIYERTREIGVMKVIGASLSDIKRLFLTEAAFIGFAGGAFGTIISLILSKIINIVSLNYGQANGISSIPIWLGLAALGFATFVGVAAGYFPAQRAMRLSALSAIKTE